MDEKQTNKKCFCGGNIVERSHIPYKPLINIDYYGPGSRNIATEDDRKIDGYHCDKCGIEYYKLPE